MIALTLLVSLAFGLAVGHECRQDWMYFNGSCYGFGESRVTWADAQGICKLFGANLAKIETEQENTFLATLSRNKKAEAVWLDGTDMFSEGYWTWINDHQHISGFTNWGLTEPNGGAAENCLSLYRHKGYMWNDSPCSSAGNFICEMPPTLSRP